MLAVFSIFILAACSVPSSPQLFIAEETMLVEVGEQRTLNFTTSFPLDDLTWTSSNPEVVSVVGGRITALKEGTSTIQVTADTGRFFDSVLITVSERATTPETPVEPEPDVPVVEEPEVPVVEEPEPEVPVVEEPGEEVSTPASIFTVTINNELGEMIQTLTLEEGSFITTSSLDLPETFKGFFLSNQTCEDEPFDLETPITEDLTLIQASFNDEAPCIQLDYIVLNGRPVAGTTLSVDVFPLGANVSISWYTSVNNRTYREIPGETESTFTVRPEDSGKFIRVYVVSDSNPPVVRYDTIKLDVFGTVSGPSTPSQLVTTEDFLAAGYIPLASLEDIIAINSPNEHTFASGTTFSALASGGLDQNYIMVKNINLATTGGFSTSLIQNTFTGSFNGNGYTLSDLSINSTGNAGLFEQLGTAKISNLNLESFHITSSGLRVGLLAGSIQIQINQEGFYDAEITNINVSNSSIEGTNTNSAVIDNVNTIVGEGRVGGLIGLVSMAHLKMSSISLSAVNVSGTGSFGRGFTGGMIGQISDDSEVSLSNISMDGSVKGIDTVGGLIGFISASELSMNEVINQADVNGSNNVAGLIGWVQDSSIDIENSSNLGNIIGSNSLGGLVGKVSDEPTALKSFNLKNSYNIGNVTGVLTAGGLIGEINDYSDISLETSYNAGQVIASSSNAGSIIGELKSSTVDLNLTGIIYLSGTAINNLSIGAIGTATVNGSATPATHVSMASISTFSTAGWDIEVGNPSNEIWSITEGATYPWLSFQGEAPSEVDVSAIIDLIDRGFNLIYTRQDLENISGSSAKYILMNDIDLNDDPWDPLNEFKGILDGNNYTISNLVININETGNSGLFKSITGALIENLTLYNVSVSGALTNGTGYTHVGVIVGQASNSTLSSVHINMADINIDPKNETIYLGGMVGETVSDSALTITNASFQGKITLATSTSGTQRVGGLLGSSQLVAQSQFNTRSDIFGSHADVEILVDNGNAETGGLIGHSSRGNIKHSFVTGTIHNSGTTTSGRTGGLIGSLVGRDEAQAEFSIFKSYNLANITGVSVGGGLVGGIIRSNGEISESYNRGIIKVTVASTTQYLRGVGGLVGFSDIDSEIKILNSYNRGSVIGIDSVGGIIGELVNSDSEIKYSYNASSIEPTRIDSSKQIEAIAGNAYFRGTPILTSDSYWDKELIGFDSRDPSALGKTTAEMRNQNTFSEWDFVDIWIIEGESYPTLRNNPEPE
jgi:hypothetical protein